MTDKLLNRETKKEKFSPANEIRRRYEDTLLAPLLSSSEKLDTNTAKSVLNSARDVEDKVKMAQIAVDVATSPVLVNKDGVIAHMNDVYCGMIKESLASLLMNEKETARLEHITSLKAIKDRYPVYSDILSAKECDIRKMFVGTSASDLLDLIYDEVEAARIGKKIEDASKYGTYLEHNIIVTTRAGKRFAWENFGDVVRIGRKIEDFDNEGLDYEAERKKRRHDVSATVSNIRNSVSSVISKFSAGFEEQFADGILGTEIAAVVIVDKETNKIVHANAKYARAFRSALAEFLDDANVIDSDRAFYFFPGLKKALLGIDKVRAASLSDDEIMNILKSIPEDSLMYVEYGVSERKTIRQARHSVKKTNEELAMRSPEGTSGSVFTWNRSESDTLDVRWGEDKTAYYRKMYDKVFGNDKPE